MPRLDSSAAEASVRLKPSMVFAALVLAACGSNRLEPAAQSQDAVDTVEAREIDDVSDSDADAADAGTPSDAGPSHGIRVVVEPSDKGAALLSAVKSAKSSIHMTMYQLSWKPLIAALTGAHQAGIDVKVLLNQKFGTPGASNAAVFKTLAAAGVEVHWAPANYLYTHEKCVLIDGREAWIMTMNGSTAGVTANREFLAIDDDAADVTGAEKIFEADFATASFSTYQGLLVVSPLNSRGRLDELVSSAEKTLLVEDEEISDAATVRAIVARAQAGAAVQIVLSDSTPTAAGARAIAALKAAGVRLVSVHKPYIHAKAIVADGKTAYVGSANLTAPSLAQNRELGVVFDDAAEVGKVESVIDSDFAAGTAL